MSKMITHRSHSLSIRRLSHVIPFFNEAESVRPVILEAIVALRSAKIPFEIVAVDDGSTDGTWQELVSLGSEYPELRLIKLRANFGQTSALAAGIRAADGDWILTMDGDGQNDPGDLPKLFERAAEGFDVVSGWRKRRKDRAFTRTIPSRMANGLISKITGLHLHDSGCSLKLYRARAINAISLYSDRHRFLPFLLHLKGFRVGEVVVNHRPRAHGTSKYGLSRTLKVFLDLIALALFARFREMPRFYFFLVAVPFMLAAAAAGGLALSQAAGTHGVEGSVTYAGATLLLTFGGISLVSFGLFAEWMMHFEWGKSHGR